MAAFAIKTLLADRGKLSIALIGVAFSLVLVNVQGGLFLGMMRKASLLVDNCDADIWVGHRGLENVDLPHEIPEIWVQRIRGVAGVRRAEPYIVGDAQMTLPDGGYEGVWIVGAEAESMLGAPTVYSKGSLHDLTRPDAIAIDELDRWKLGDVQPGDIVEISGNRAKVVATTRGLLGFLTTPYVFTRLDLARRYSRLRQGYCSFFLVEADDGQDLNALVDAISKRVPDLDVFTSEQLSHKSQMYWIARTGIGQSFGGATVLGLIVGLVMVAQSLYAFVLDHLADFAALKAIGAEDGQIYHILIVQGLVIAILGSILGTGIAFLVERFGSTPLAPIEVPMWLRLASVAVILVICLVSAVLPFRRLSRVDPVTVLQG